MSNYTYINSTLRNESYEGARITAVNCRFIDCDFADTIISGTGNSFVNCLGLRTIGPNGASTEETESETKTFDDVVEATDGFTHSAVNIGGNVRQSVIVTGGGQVINSRQIVQGDGGTIIGAIFDNLGGKKETK
jgi:hypothetical protein